MRRPTTRFKAAIDQLAHPALWVDRIADDPIEFPHRYSLPRDIEVAGLIAVSLAYGRVANFKRIIGELLSRLGPHPASAVANLSVAGAAEIVSGLIYRFNVGTDLAVLLMGMGAQLNQFVSLESAFLAPAPKLAVESWRARITRFAALLRRSAPERELVAAIGPTRGLAHLLPISEGGVAKRFNLYLRWMVRGPDEIDFGIWKQLSPSELFIPLDTHVARVSRHLGLTTRRTLTWATVEEITSSLRAIDPADPIRYDFALCHLGMSGRCPLVVSAASCRRCSMQKHCQTGKRF